MKSLFKKNQPECSGEDIVSEQPKPTLYEQLKERLEAGQQSLKQDSDELSLEAVEQRREINARYLGRYYVKRLSVSDHHDVAHNREGDDLVQLIAPTEMDRGGFLKVFNFGFRLVRKNGSKKAEVTLISSYDWEKKFITDDETREVEHVDFLTTLCEIREMADRLSIEMYDVRMRTASSYNQYY